MADTLLKGLTQVEKSSESGLIVRNPPGAVAWDWDAADFTIDGAYHDFDCSSIVPSTAKAVIFMVNANGNARDIFTMRPIGFSQSTAILKCQTTAAVEYGQYIVAVTSEGLFTYGISATVATVGLTVVGWFE